MAEEQSKVGEASVPSPTAEASAGWSCSRCVAIRTAVEPLAWTLSTLRQTGRGAAQSVAAVRVGGGDEHGGTAATVPSVAGGCVGCE